MATYLVDVPDAQAAEFEANLQANGLHYRRDDADVEVPIPAAAEAAGIAYTTLFYAVQSGRVEGRKVGRQWMTTRRAVQAALDAGRLRPRNIEEG